MEVTKIHFMKRRTHSGKARKSVLSSPKLLYLFIGLILTSETAAISLLKEFSISNSVLYLYGGLALYGLVATFLVQSFKYEGMGIVNILWSAFSVVAVVVTGVALFGETVTTSDVIGMSMVMTGVLVLRIGEAKRKARGAGCMHVVPSALPRTF